MNKSISFLACLGAVITLSQCGFIKNAHKSRISAFGQDKKMFLIPIGEIKDKNEKIGAVVSCSQNKKETNLLLKTVIGVGYSHDF